ncbi:MAG: cyclase family protein [Flavobacteriales bacterium]|nr:cyclase family protein [Flavobacteriales bacterium]MBP9081231.1 cyclase family protein [Flavobacteriales bacterium]
MIAAITHQGRTWRIALDQPIDLSLPLDPDSPGPRAWYVGAPAFTPVNDGERTYTVQDGAPVNFRNVQFNPHGNGTHTESVGHIARTIHPVGNLFQRYWFTAQLVSVPPQERRTPAGTARVITLEQLQSTVHERAPEALVVRTRPNGEDKRTRQWTDTDPPFMEAEACRWLRGIGVRHLLLDLPSVDRERDEGQLAAHHAFWDFPRTTDLGRTITEMIFVPDTVRDGDYLLELQVPHFINDAAPSRPLLYAPRP